MLGGALVGALAGCGTLRGIAGADTPRDSTDTFPVGHTDAEWRTRLSDAQYDVLRAAGTETPFTSALNDEHRAGVFACAGCGSDLFSSSAKFESGTGWPSFSKALDGSVIEKQDDSIGMTRTEVRCHRCGGHLGHVFDDGPEPTGLRYCMNGVALTFRAT